MKIVLLTLSGDPDFAIERLAAQFPDAAIESIARAVFEKGSMAARTSALRRRKPDVFAVATERLVWQRGQDAFLLLGALAGARRSIILDAHSGWREESKADVLLRVPVRLAREFATSKGALRRAESALRRLEAAVERGEHRPPVSGTVGKNLQMIYLRASPGPGTQAGGAASHINGFVNAALQLGMQVSFITNDEIAGLDQGSVFQLPSARHHHRQLGAHRCVV